MGRRHFSSSPAAKHCEPLTQLWHLGFGHDHCDKRQRDIKTFSGNTCRKLGRHSYQIGEIDPFDDADPARALGKCMSSGRATRMSYDQHAFIG